MRRKLAAMVIMLAAGSAAAEELAASWSDGIKFSSADKAFSLRVGGRILTDATFGDDFDGAYPAEEGTEIRSARISLSGLMYSNVEFKAEYDLANAGNEGSKKTIETVDAAGDVHETKVVTKADELSLKDVYVGFVGLPVGTLRFGHMYEPMFMDNMTSTKYLVFLETALPVDAFSPYRNTGVSVSKTTLMEGAMTYEVGAFKDTADGKRQGEGGWSGSGRVTFMPWRSNGNGLQLGASASLRDALDDTVSHAPQPEMHMVPSLIGGSIPASGEKVGGLESAAVFGPAHVMAEYIASSVDAKEPAGDAELSGYYVQVGYLLTGEHRPLREGNWQRLRPKHNLGAGGYGALELKARYSSVDLSDGGFQGGEEDNIGTGVNWYLNPNTVVLFDLTLVSATQPDGKDIDGTAGTVRCQVDF